MIKTVSTGDKFSERFDCIDHSRSTSSLVYIDANTDKTLVPLTVPEQTETGMISSFLRFSGKQLLLSEGKRAE